MKARYLALVGALAMSACMPLEQAPLVYSSKQQFGIGVSAGAADSPGFDVNIGYKGLDAAFVPVFVAKACPKAAEPCDGVNYNVRPIMGYNAVKARSEAEREQITNLNAKIATETGRIDSGEKEAAKATALLDSLGEKPSLEARVTALKGKQAAATATDTTDSAPQNDTTGAQSPTDAATSAQTLPQLTKEEAEELTKSEVRLGELRKIENKKKEIQDQLTAANESIKRSREARAKYIEALDVQLRLRNEVADDNKDDALSVYGSFNGSAGGGKDGASLSLGKVFSTGIAAQNLSQGIGAGARAAATADCFVQAEVAYRNYSGKEADRPEHWRKLMRACGIRD